MASNIRLEDVDFSNLNQYPNIGYNKDGELIELSFNGNILLRPYNTFLPMTEEATLEFEKCRNDMFYFMEKYCYIHTQDHGKIIVNLRKYQKEFISNIHDESRVIGLLARQIGKTSSCALYIVYNLVFQKDWISLIVANEDDLKKEIVDMIQSIYENLPPFLQSGVIKWNMGSLELSNGCKVKSAVAGKNAGRGKTPNFVMLDEAGWIDEDKITAFLDSVKASLSSGTNNKFVIISTPNGYNTFHKYWKDAKEGKSKFKTFFANWRAVPGRDDKWKEQKMKEDNMTPMEWQQNYECAFLGSSLTLLPPETLGNLSKKEPIAIDYIIEGTKLYTEYNPDSYYLITVDSSKTVGKKDAENDYISLKVLELRPDKIVEALTFRSNNIHYLDMAEKIFLIGEAFNFPWAIVENNEGSGQSIVDHLHSAYEYPNIYADPKHEGLILGIRTTSNRRHLGLTTLRKLIQDSILEVNDEDTIDEFFTFIKVGKRYQAAEKTTDDCIMSLNLLVYFLMDDSNDYEITLDTYLKDIDFTPKESEDDTDFFVGQRGKVEEQEDLLWLTMR